MPPLRILVIALVLAACDGPPVPGDAAAAAPDAASEIAAPAPPILTPCAAGWSEVTDADTGIVTCDPWPATGHDESCAYDEAHLPGTDGCARIGTACAADGWPADLPTGRTIVYVDDDAAPGGDGSSRAHAYQSLAAAATAAPNGAVIAVATGHYDVIIGLNAGVTLWGACVMGTRLTSSVPSIDTPVVELGNPGGQVRNLAIDSAMSPGIWSDEAASVHDVVVESATFIGIVAGSPLTLDHVAVRGTRQRMPGEPGYGIAIVMGGALVIDHADIAGNLRTGVDVPTGHADVHDTVIRGTRSDVGSGVLGVGIHASAGGSLAAQRIVCAGNHYAAILAGGAATRVDLGDSRVEGTREDSGGSLGALFATTGATIAATRVSIDATVGAGVLVFDDATQAQLTDVVIHDTRGLPSEGGGGAGVSTYRGGSATLSRVLVDHASETALLAVGGSIEASDVLSRSTVSVTSTPIAAGLLAQNGAHVHVSRFRIEGAHAFGVGVLHGSVVMLEQLTIARVSTSECATTTCPGYSAGFGVASYFGGMAHITGFRIDDAALCGVAVGIDDPVWGATGLDLSNGLVDRSPVGACVQVDGYDTERLHDHVEFRDVGVPLQATSYRIDAPGI